MSMSLFAGADPFGLTVGEHLVFPDGDACLQVVVKGHLYPMLAVIPGRLEEPNPESRDSGFDATHRPGMTSVLGLLRSFAMTDIANDT